jgi:F420-0:gamma-glutamyl ligase-like protein
MIFKLYLPTDYTTVSVNETIHNMLGSDVTIIYSDDDKQQLNIYAPELPYSTDAVSIITPALISALP